MLFFISLSLLAIVSLGKQITQEALGISSWVDPPATIPFAESFKPFDDLGSLSVDGFTVLSHFAFPKYTVRVKKSTDFCDGTVNAYTGYIDIEARHLFFYFFESRRNPDQDDVIFWTNGGPGASSSLGLFMELGPCRVEKANATTFNPYAWNEQANIFFIDQPIGVGFSYADYGETVSNTEEAAEDIAAFVAIFFEHFTKFKGRSFHMAGESYGGRYIPAFASKIYDQNAYLTEAGLTPINLTSIMLGNGLSDLTTLFRGWYEIQCSQATTMPVTSISKCVKMRQTIPRCEKMFKESCSDITDPIGCGAAMSFCFSIAMPPPEINPYDLSKPCEGDAENDLCYFITREVTAFLNRQDIREVLGVDAQVGNFTTHNDQVQERFFANLDPVFPTMYHIANLLERNVKALIYVGANDLLCPWPANEQMTLNLDWRSKEAFNSQPLREWMYNGSAAGLTRSAGPLTFATIYGAGHMAPYDKPEASLELVNKWLAGDSL